MMISREIFDLTGGWSKEFGIYGGGENFMNYTLAVLGKKKWIFPEGTLFHHGEKRGYSYNYDDFVRNRILAHYLFGGEVCARACASVLRGRQEVLTALCSDAINRSRKHRAHIRKNQVNSIEEAISPWVRK
jgi:hypothetical protein